MKMQRYLVDTRLVAETYSGNGAVKWILRPVQALGCHAGKDNGKRIIFSS
jgi:hypothetical protein